MSDVGRPSAPNAGSAWEVAAGPAPAPASATQVSDESLDIDRLFAIPDPVEQQLLRWREESQARRSGAGLVPPLPPEGAPPVATDGADVMQPTQTALNGAQAHDGARTVNGALSWAAPGTPEPGRVAAYPEPPRSRAMYGDRLGAPAAGGPIAVAAALPTPLAQGVPATEAAATVAGAPPAIVATNLRKEFKGNVAVRDVSLTVETGSIVALLGPNGAGKTTTVNMLCTLLRPDGGVAVVAGHDVVAEAPAVREAIMLTGQFAALDEKLTGRENLVLFGRLLGLSKKNARTRADELLSAFGLTEAASRKVGQYSGGMRRRIDIACGLVTAPEVVFLDEPTTGLDPRSRQEVWSLVAQLRDAGVTVLLTTQYLEEADVLADRIIVIDRGQVIAEGTADELKAATGASYCEVTPVHKTDLMRLFGILDGLSAELVPASDPSGVAVPAPDGPDSLVEVLRRTDAAGIPLSDVAMRRPSLDEVFLALTDPQRAHPSRPTPDAVRTHEAAWSSIGDRTNG